MKQALTIFLTGLAIAGAVTLVSARSTHREEAAAAPRVSADASTAYAQAGDDTVSATVPITIFAPRFTSSPRIIHVPPNARNEAHDDDAPTSDGDTATDIDTDYVPPPHPPMVKRIKPALRADMPPAPPPRAALTEKHELSPVYPTPRFSNSTAAVPRDSPVDAVPPPPIGYTPPSDLPPQQK